MLDARKASSAAIDNYLRLALNQMSVLLTLEGHERPTLKLATDCVIRRLRDGLPDDPSAFPPDKGHFPFRQGPGGWIGESIRVANGFPRRPMDHASEL